MSPIIGKTRNEWEKLIHILIILFLIVSLFILISFHYFLHNHEADGDVHKDCLICIFLYLTGFNFSGGLITVFVLYPLIFKINQFVTKPVLKIYCRIFFSRAPPIDYRF